MYNEKIVDIATGKETLRNYTKEEIAEVEKAYAESLIRVAEAKQKEKNRESARAKLAALGLTEDEIAAL